MTFVLTGMRHSQRGRLGIICAVSLLANHDVGADSDPPLVWWCHPHVHDDHALRHVKEGTRKVGQNKRWGARRRNSGIWRRCNSFLGKVGRWALHAPRLAKHSVAI